jgi:hypothetical protein
LTTGKSFWQSPAVQLIHAFGKKDGRALCGAKLQDGWPTNAKQNPDWVTCPKCLNLLPQSSPDTVDK